MRSCFPVTAFTGVAVWNIHEIPMTAQGRLFNSNGQIVGQTGITVPAAGHVSFVIPDKFPGVGTTFEGTLQLFDSNLRPPDFLGWKRKVRNSSRSLCCQRPSSSTPSQIWRKTFYVQPWTVRPRIVGTFQASGGSRNDVEVVVAEVNERRNWGRGISTSMLYSTGRVSTGRIDAPLQPGQHYCAAFNSDFSLLTAKHVSVEIEIQAQAPTPLGSKRNTVQVVMGSTTVSGSGLRGLD